MSANVLAKARSLSAARSATTGFLDAYVSKVNIQNNENVNNEKLSLHLMRKVPGKEKSPAKPGAKFGPEKSALNHPPGRKAGMWKCTPMLCLSAMTNAGEVRVEERLPLFAFFRRSVSEVATYSL